MTSRQARETKGRRRGAALIFFTASPDARATPFRRSGHDLQSRRTTVAPWRRLSKPCSRRKKLWLMLQQNRRTTDATISRIGVVCETADERARFKPYRSTPPRSLALTRGSVVAIDLFTPLVTLLSLDGERCDRTRI